MSDDESTGREENVPVDAIPSLKAKLNRVTWPIFVSLTGIYLLMMGFGTGELTFLVLGAVILCTCLYTGRRLYVGLQWVGPKVLEYLHFLKTISFVLIGLFVLFTVIDGGLRDAKSLNAEQKKMVGTVTPDSQRDFLRLSCKAKSVCVNYPDVKQGCAAAGNIQKCIDIRMNGEDSSMCLDNGEIAGFDDKTRPSTVQCAAFKIAELIK